MKDISRAELGAFLRTLNRPVTDPEGNFSENIFLSEDESVLNVKDLCFTEVIEIPGSFNRIGQDKKLNFSSSVFKVGLNIRGSDFSMHLEKCEFVADSIWDFSAVKEVDIVECHSTKPLTIVSHKNRKSRIIQGGSYDELYIQGGSFSLNDIVKLGNLQVNKGQITIENCDSIDLIHVQECESLSLVNCKLKAQATNILVWDVSHLTNLNRGLLNLNKTTLKELSFNVGCPATITIEDNCEVDNLRIQNVGETKLSLSDSVIRKVNLSQVNLNPLAIKCDVQKSIDTLEMNDCTGNIEIRDGSYTISESIGAISIENSSLQSFKLSEIWVGSLSIDTWEHQMDTTFLLRNVIVSNLTLKNVVVRNEEVLFADCRCGPLEDVSNQKLKEASDTNGGHRFLDRRLVLKDSKLGRTRFRNCAFSNFDHFEVSGTDLTQISIIGTQFPKELFRSDGMTYSAIRDTYGQLKKLFDAKGDSIQGQAYQSQELIAFRKEIGEDRRAKRPNSWFISRYRRGESFQLCLTELTTRHGLSWGRGIVATILFGILFHCLFMLSFDNPEIRISLFQIDWDITKDAFASYIRFLSPFRPFSYSFSIGGAQVIEGWLTPLWDLLGRIFIAFGVYETVQAFRRHGRK